MDKTMGEILALSGQVLACERRMDADALAELLDEDYRGVDLSGMLLSKAEALARYRRSDGGFEELAATAVSVSAFGAAAYETGELRVAVYAGEHRYTGNCRYSQFWVRREHGWKLAGSHLSSLKSNE